MSKTSSNQSFPGIPFGIIDISIILAAYVIVILMTIGLYIVRQIIDIPSISDWLGISSALLGILLEYCSSIFLLLVIFFFIIRRYNLNLITTGFKSLKLKTTIIWVAVGFFATFLLWILVTPIIIILFPNVDLAESQNIIQTNFSPAAQALMIIYAVIIGPFIEELIFRGIILPGIANRFNFFSGVIFSTLTWSILHFQWNIIIFTSIFGIVLSYMYYRTQSLWPTFITHVLKNLIAVIAIYLIS